MREFADNGVSETKNNKNDRAVNLRHPEVIQAAQMADILAGDDQDDAEAQGNVQNSMKFFRAQLDQCPCEEHCSVPGIEYNAQSFALMTEREVQ